MEEKQMECPMASRVGQRSASSTRPNSSLSPRSKISFSRLLMDDGAMTVDPEEQKEMEQAMQAGLTDFVRVTCEAIHSILSLNYQSVKRFRKTAAWQEFQRAVDIADLIDKRSSLRDI